MDDSNSEPSIWGPIASLAQLMILIGCAVWLGVQYLTPKKADSNGGGSTASKPQNQRLENTIQFVNLVYAATQRLPKESENGPLTAANIGEYSKKYEALAREASEIASELRSFSFADVDPDVVEWGLSSADLIDRNANYFLDAARVMHAIDAHNKGFDLTSFALETLFRGILDRDWIGKFNEVKGDEKRLKLAGDALNEAGIKLRNDSKVYASATARLRARLTERYNLSPNPQ